MMSQAIASLQVRQTARQIKIISFLPVAQATIQTNFKKDISLLKFFFFLQKNTKKNQ
jgi:hypothetical protein